jgi:hypothetical protein
MGDVAVRAKKMSYPANEAGHYNLYDVSVKIVSVGWFIGRPVTFAWIPATSVRE